MDKLQFDTERLCSMKGDIERAIGNLQTVNKSLQEQMQTLREKWNTPAGKVFFENQNLDWSESVEDYIQVMNTMKEMIEYAILKYEPIQQEAERLSIPTASK